MVLTEAQWAEFEPLVEACHPHIKMPSDLHRTVGAFIRRCTNKAKRRSIPTEPGSRWNAAQIFICWATLEVWDRLLAMAYAGGVELGMTVLDGTPVRPRTKAAGACNKRSLAEAAVKVRRLGALAVAMAPRPQSWRTRMARPSCSDRAGAGARTSAYGWRLLLSRFPCAHLEPDARPAIRPDATKRPRPVRTEPTPTATGSSASEADL